MSESPDHRTRRENEARSLDVTQRAIVSALVGIVFGTFSAVLAAYLAIRGDQDLPSFSVTGLWIMTRPLAARCNRGDRPVDHHPEPAASRNLVFASVFVRPLTQVVRRFPLAA